MRIIHCSDINFHLRGGDDRVNHKKPICGEPLSGRVHDTIVQPQEFSRLIDANKEYLYNYMYWRGECYICQNCAKHEDIPFLLLNGLDE